MRNSVSKITSSTLKKNNILYGKAPKLALARALSKKVGASFNPSDVISMFEWGAKNDNFS